MATPLTEDEKEKCRYHLGYMETSFGSDQAAASLQFGVPRPVQTAFLLEEAIQNLLTNPFAVDRVRRVLNTLENLERQIEASSCTLPVEQLGEITLHPGRAQGKFTPDLLEREYVRWAYRLADILGVPIYPFSRRFQRTGPGPVPVRG